MSPAQQRACDELLPRYGVDPATPLDLERIYGRRAPVVLEIGFGMGETTAAIAAAQPDIDFLGVEMHLPGVGALLRRIDEQGLANVRVLRHDAVEVVATMIAPATLAGIHVFFPDPWPKKRHHKRRLLQPAFVHEIALARRARRIPARRDRLGGLRAGDPRHARGRATAREHRSRLRAAPSLPTADQVRGAGLAPRSPRARPDLPPENAVRENGVRAVIVPG